MFDVISIGDSTVDIFLFLDDASTLCDIDKVHCRICIPYGGKVPVRRLMSVNGAGNAANCAVGWSRMGLRTALHTMIGHDARGRDILRHLRHEKVHTKLLQIDPKYGTNYSTIIEYQGDRTILAYHEERHYRLSKLPKTRWLFFSSIAGNHDEFNAALHEYVKRNRIRLAFNPGSRQMQLGPKGMAPILEVTDVLFVNLEEAKRLLPRSSPRARIERVLLDLHKLGPKIVVITDGVKGSYCFDGSTAFFLPIFEVPVVQHTGCGDAYASGFLGALLYGFDTREAMRWGSVNAAGVIQQIGSQAGLLGKTDIQNILQAHKNYLPLAL